MGGTQGCLTAVAVILLVLPGPFATAQVVIRERIAISPSPPQSPPNLSVSSSRALLEKRTTSYGGQYITTTRSGVRITMSGIVEIGELPRGTGYELEVGAGSTSVVIDRRVYLCDYSRQQATTAFPPTTIPLCGTITAGLRLLKRSTYTYYCSSAWAGSGTSLTVSGNEATYTLEGMLTDLDVYPARLVPIVATVRVSASVDPAYEVARIDVQPNGAELVCGGSVGVSVAAYDGNGRSVTTCPGSEPMTCIARHNLCLAYRFGLQLRRSSTGSYLSTKHRPSTSDQGTLT